MASFLESSAFNQLSKKDLSTSRSFMEMFLVLSCQWLQNEGVARKLSGPISNETKLECFYGLSEFHRISRA
jgi:hypothetical protein